MYVNILNQLLKDLEATKIRFKSNPYEIFKIIDDEDGIDYMAFVKSRKSTVRWADEESDSD